MKSQDLDRLADYLVCPQCHQEELIKGQDYFRCSSCQARYPIIKNIPIIISPKKQKRIIQRWRSQRDRNSYSSLNKTSRIKSLLEENSRTRFALDVSCGVGTYSDCFQFGSLGFDIIPDFIQMALGRNKNPDNIFCVADANEFPFKEKMFDLVYCGQSLEHFTKKKSEELIKKILRSSRDLIIVDVPNDSTVIHQILRGIIKVFYRSAVKRRAAENQCPEQRHLRTFTIGDLQKFSFQCHGCIGSNTRTEINFPLFWDIYDKVVFNHPLFAGTLIGIKKKCGIGIFVKKRQFVL